VEIGIAHNICRARQVRREVRGLDRLGATASRSAAD
jgi:hypothetical protein